MICPVCGTVAPHEVTDADKDSVTVEYRCSHGHIIQFILPDFLFTLLIINDTGDELYQLHFDASEKITKIIDWDGYNEVDLEGTNVRREY